MGKYKVGDKVKLRPDSRYYGGDGQIPVNGFGVITEDNRPGRVFEYEVHWKGDYNQYQERDLEPFTMFKGNK